MRPAGDVRLARSRTTSCSRRRAPRSSSTPRAACSFPPQIPERRQRRRRGRRRDRLSRRCRRRRSAITATSASSASARTRRRRISSTRSTRASTRSSCRSGTRRSRWGPCQGRLCSTNAIRYFAKAKGVDEDTIGTTTARPPSTPVSMGLVAGYAKEPGKRTSLHHRHKDLGGDDDVDRRLAPPALLRPGG